MVRPLTKELQNIAIEELHEDLERVGDDIKHIQKWIKQQPYLNAPTGNITNFFWDLMRKNNCFSFIVFLQNKRVAGR